MKIIWRGAEWSGPRKLPETPPPGYGSSRTLGGSIEPRELPAALPDNGNPDHDLAVYGVAYGYRELTGQARWLDPRRVTVFRAPREEISREKLARKLFESRMKANYPAWGTRGESWDELVKSARDGWLRSADDVIRLIGSGELP